MTLQLAFQPIICTRAGQQVGHEVLARLLNHGGLHSPEGLLKAGQWAQLDMDVLTELRRQLRRVSFLETIFVNVSKETLCCDEAFAAWKTRAAGLCEELSTPLHVEVSEHTPRNVLSRRWKEIRDIGARLVLDDFGTGKTTVEHLHDVPWAVCKFEASRLAQGLDLEAIAICHQLGVELVVEKVETQTLQSQAESLGITYQQGYRHGRPQLIQNLIDIPEVC